AAQGGLVERVVLAKREALVVPVRGPVVFRRQGVVCDQGNLADGHGTLRQELDQLRRLSIRFILEPAQGQGEFKRVAGTPVRDETALQEAALAEFVVARIALLPWTCVLGPHGESCANRVAKRAADIALR